MSADKKVASDVPPRYLFSKNLLVCDRRQTQPRPHLTSPGGQKDASLSGFWRFCIIVNGRTDGHTNRPSYGDAFKNVFFVLEVVKRKSFSKFP